MATNVVNSNINWPRVPFIDPTTGFPSLPWLLFLQNPNFISITSQATIVNGNQQIDGNELVTGTLTAYGGISGGTF